MPKHPVVGLSDHLHRCRLSVLIFLLNQLFLKTQFSLIAQIFLIG
ncbi:hypothetical protein AZ54_09320 [Xanthomonas oryzae pv. oryzae PXO86]|nr:hypothetical protein AZ54_09320 [Xanthomonas oryzae pv. oryzae PXO86]